MIEQPANISYLSAARLIASDANFENANITTLSAYNFYADNIINNTDLYGNLTVYGAITALSGITLVNTFNTSTTALSVINIGTGPALYVSQGSNIKGVAVFVGANNQEILRINNTDPNLNQPTVVITKGPTNRSLSAIGISTFESIEAPLATLTNLNAASASIGVENVTTIDAGTVNAGTIKATSISADGLVMPVDSYALFGNMTVYGQINALSGVQNISSFVLQTSSLSVVSVAQAPALFVRQTGGNPVTQFFGNTTEVLRINNPAVVPTAPSIVVTGSISSSNIVQAAGGNSNNWNNVYTNVQNTSSTWTGGNIAFTNVQTNSANWQTAYNSVNTNQTNWTAAYTSVNANQANWTNVYTNVQTNSASWTGGSAALTNVQSNSAIYSPTKLLTAANFNAQAGLKYLVNTTSGIVYGTLPTPPVTGSVISFEDPFGTWDTNSFIVLGNGSNIESSSTALSCEVEDLAFNLIYVGGSRGWKVS
jgi:hypothetical protein